MLQVEKPEDLIESISCAWECSKKPYFFIKTWHVNFDTIKMNICGFVFNLQEESIE
jgi:hypothetical protein